MELRIAAADRLYTVVEDLTSLFRVVVSGRVRDAIDGEPLRSGFRVAAGRRELVARTLADGLFAVAADPALAFPSDAVAYDFEIEVSAHGYRPVTVAVPVPPASTFPLAALDVALRRLPVRVQGRVVRAAGGDPVAGARVTVRAPEVLALHVPLAFAHGSGAEVRECALTPAGAIRHLELPFVGGGATVTLSHRTGIAPGDVLRFGPPHRLELGVVDTLAPEPADPGQPGEVTLRAPLSRSLPAGAEVQEVTPAAGAASALLDRPVEAGEGVLVLDGPLAADTVRIETAVSPEVEYHAVGALTDDAGYYRLEGVAGVAEATFAAAAAGLEDGERPWVMDPDSPVNVLDFRLEAP